MDSSLVLNVLALVISAAAFATSVAAARRQLKLARDSNVLPIVIDVFKETRSPEFSQSIEYIRDKLVANQASDDGYRNLPEEAKAHIRRVGLFYDDIGKLVAHGVVDEQLILEAYGRSVAKAWSWLAPYVYSEREKHQNLTMVYFEDLAGRADATSMKQVHDALGLRRQPPAQTLY